MHKPRERQVGRRGTALATILMLVGVLLVPSVAQAQASPCDGGPGLCLPGDTYTRTYTSRGSGTCEWTVTVNWGDGTSDTETYTHGPGVHTFDFVHTYAEPGVYTVTDSGSGVGATGNPCTFNPAVLTVEVPGGPNCQGSTATIVGTPGDDVIEGTSGNDVIVGLGGNDVIHGRGGNDIICGNGGADDIRGGSGVDIIYGGKGRDTIRGGSSADIIFGNSGRDRLFGNGGVDGISGGSGADRVNGGKGGDVLRGNKGNDTILGKSGRDNIDGGSGRDDCRGGKGRDTVTKCE